MLQYIRICAKRLYVLPNALLALTGRDQVVLCAILGPISLLRCEFKAIFALAGAKIFEFFRAPKWDYNRSFWHFFGKPKVGLQ